MGDQAQPNHPGAWQIAVLALTLLLPAAHAWQDPAAPAPASPPAAAPKPLVPAAASSIAAAPAAFYGQNVTITAAVDRLVSATTFIVDQDVRKSGEGGVLVIVEHLSAPPALNSYVTVIGEVVRHDGAPAIRATAVIDATMVDLAKRRLPPMTPEEEAFGKVMKRISPAFNSLRQAVGAASAETGGAAAGALKAAFAETETFWKKRGKPDAIKWAADGRAHAEALQRAIAAGKWDDAKAAATALQQTCSACHGVYRERQDDGSYRIRP